MKKNNILKKDYFTPRKKKKFGQHFLRKQSVVDNMIHKVKIDNTTHVLEIGCGDGFLTQAILNQTPCKQLWCYEIDPEWADFVQNKIRNPRLKLKLENILDVDFSKLEQHKPWVILANLPYQITFPIFFMFQKNKHLIKEGFVMIQEEVAQKIVATHGKGYSSTSLFLQHHFDMQLLDKIEPQAFTPPPKVFSRLIYFKPKEKMIEIPREQEFWKFLKLCFLYPRRTLRNNLKTTHYNLNDFKDDLLSKRAQELSFNEFLQIWKNII